MLSKFSLPAVFLLTLSSLLNVSASDADQIKKLKTAETQLDRLNILKKESDWIFDFKKDSKTYAKDPGSVAVANGKTWPAAVGNGLTMQLITLGPCGVLPAHFHPRAANVVIDIVGTTYTQMFEENGAKVINETLTPFKATIFPQGSVHTMVNQDCNSPSILISALNNEDQGTTNLANTLYQLDYNLVGAAFGGGKLPDQTNIPAIGSGATVSENCVAKCPAGSAAKKALKVAKGMDDD